MNESLPESPRSVGVQEVTVFEEAFEDADASVFNDSETGTVRVADETLLEVVLRNEEPLGLIDCETH